MSDRNLFYQAACMSLVLLVTNAGMSSGVPGNDDVRAISEHDLAAEFKDKIILLEVNRSSALESKTSSVALANVRFAKLGNRHFIIGWGVAPDEDTDDWWYKDMLVGVPCESIVRFHAMTQKQFDEYIEMWKEHSGQ